MAADKFLESFYKDGFDSKEFTNTIDVINSRSSVKFQCDLLKKEFGEKFENDKEKFLDFLRRNPGYLDFHQYPFGMIAGYLVFRNREGGKDGKD